MKVAIGPLREKKDVQVLSEEKLSKLVADKNKEFLQDLNKILFDRQIDALIELKNEDKNGG